MSMETYPLEQKCALVIMPQAACAMLLKDSIENGIEAELVPERVLAAVRSGRSYWSVASDPEFFEELAETGWMNVSDAHDLMEQRNVEDVVHCSEFDGTAVPASGDGFGDEKSSEIGFEDDFAVFLFPQCESSLFKAAYGNKDELLQEYKSRMSGLLEDDFPYTRYVMDVSGTYFC